MIISLTFNIQYPTHLHASYKTDHSKLAALLYAVHILPSFSTQFFELVEVVHPHTRNIHYPSTQSRTKIITGRNSIKDVDSCKFVYFKPTKTLSGLISNLHASLAAIIPNTQLNVNAHLIYRKYTHNQGRGKSQ